MAHEDGPGQGPCKTCSDTGLECVYSKPIPKPPAAAQGLAEETSNSSSFTAGGLAGFRQAAVAGGGGAVDFYGNGFGFDELHRMQMWEHFNNAGLAFQLASTKGKIGRNGE